MTTKLTISMPTAFIACLALLSVPCARSEDQKVPEAKGEVSRRLAYPNPFPRLKTLEIELKKASVEVKWTALYDSLARRNVDADTLRSQAERAQVLIGVRLADSIVALLARDRTRLKACAADVLTLSQSLEIRTGEISSDAVVRALDQEDWDAVFFELGSLQQDVVMRLDSDENRSKGALVAAGAWLQGLRYATRLISDHQNKVDLSNFLRAAPIAELITKEIKTASPEVLEKPAVKAAIETLIHVFPILNIGKTDTIPKEKVDKVFELATAALLDAKA